MAIQFVDVPGLAQTGRFRHLVIADGRRTAYLSGQVPLDEDNVPVGAGDFDAQVHQVFRNLAIILDRLEVGWERVARMYIYIVDFSTERYARVREIREEYLGEIVPVATVLGVTALALPEFEIEIELTVDLD